MTTESTEATEAIAPTPAGETAAMPPAGKRTGKKDGEKASLKDRLLAAFKAHKKAFIIGGVALVLIVVALVALLTRPGGVETTVQEATAETGSIATTVTGSGTLEAGTSTDVEAPTGITIDEVLVEEGDSVSEGDALATVTKASVAEALLSTRDELDEVEEEISSLSSSASTEGTDEYLEAIILSANQEELEEKEELLEELLDTLTITATADGTVSSVNVSDGTEIAASSSTGSDAAASADTASADTASASVSSSTVETGLASTGTLARTAALGVDDDESESSTLVATSIDEATLSSSSTIYTDDAEITFADSSDGVITDIALTVTAPATGATPQSEIASSDGVYTGTISWNCSTSTFAADTVYTATIRLTTESSAITFASDIEPVVEGATTVSTRVISYESEDNRVLIIKATFAKTESASSTSSGTGSGTSSGTGSGSGTSSGTGSSGSSSSGSSSSGSSSSGTSSTDSTGDASVVDSQTAAAFVIASDEDATITLTVDEADILSVEEGQTAVVSIDSIDGETFEGEVTNVSTAASSGSGSVKYSAEITLERTEDMVLGMSASATINVSEAEDAVLIPAAALQESGNTTFVYTELDSEGNPTGAVEVETGLSDGTNVEITSGLSEGDTVYYTRTTDSDSSDTADASSITGMDFSGEMPGGDMPSGDAPSGSMGGEPSGSGQ